MNPLVMIDGTWGKKDKTRWVDPVGPWVLAAQAEGVTFLDLKRPFDWSTALSGLYGKKHMVWTSWGRALIDHVECRLDTAGPVDIIAWSHGGQVAAYAAYYGLKVGKLITLATPMRQDMKKIWLAGHKNIGLHYHLYTGWRDYMQLFGEIGDGVFSIQRQIPGAENLQKLGQDHSSLTDVKEWDNNDWWRYLRPVS